MALVVGPFEEEEMGIDIASDVVKVKGEEYLWGGQGEEVSVVHFLGTCSLPHL